jgi:hypothetical protein
LPWPLLLPLSLSLRLRLLLSLQLLLQLPMLLSLSLQLSVFAVILSAAKDPDEPNLATTFRPFQPLNFKPDAP